MDVAALIERMRSRADYAGQLEHVEVLPARPGQFAEPEEPLPEQLARLLAARGIEQLYSHQVRALEAARAGPRLCRVTGTASGKTLCYNLPILETALDDPERGAVSVSDQGPGARSAQGSARVARRRCRAGGRFSRACSTATRPRPSGGGSRPRPIWCCRIPTCCTPRSCRIIPSGVAVFGNLRYVVLDEMHTYRGILGANVACVLRRLQRVCEHYGSRPVFLAASATIANPGELAAPTDGPRRGGGRRRRRAARSKVFRPLESHSAGQRSPGTPQRHRRRGRLMVEAMQAGGQALTFTRTRQAAELVHRYVEGAARGRRHSKLADQVRAYRGGYLPIERREIEAQLFGGDLRGVAATNALELGVDIGSLDVALLAGYPGTIASTWQQAGRSGRRHDESLAILLAGNDPVDQYLSRHPDYFFAQSPEHAVVDPENPYVLANHLQAAAFELPLGRGRRRALRPAGRADCRRAVRRRRLTAIDGQYYFSGGQNPAARVSLRHMSDNTFSIVLPRGRSGKPAMAEAARRRDHEVIANVDAISAPELVYPRPFICTTASRISSASWIWRARWPMSSGTRWTTTRRPCWRAACDIKSERARRAALCRKSLLAYGDVDVTWQTVAFKKIKFGTRENIGQGPVDIPAQTLPTTGAVARRPTTRAHGR